jgi:hypothetical protein
MLNALFYLRTYCSEQVLKGETNNVEPNYFPDNMKHEREYLLTIFAKTPKAKLKNVFKLFLTSNIKGNRITCNQK